MKITMADKFTSDDNPPDGALVRAEVIVFADGSIHVGGQVSPYMGGDHVANAERTLSTALKIGLELMGYDVLLEESPNGVGDGVDCTSIGINPDLAVVA